MTSAADRLWAPMTIQDRLREAIVQERDEDRLCLLVDALGELRSLEGRLSDANWRLYPDRMGT